MMTSVQRAALDIRSGILDFKQQAAISNAKLLLKAGLLSQAVWYVVACFERNKFKASAVM